MELKRVLFLTFLPRQSRDNSNFSHSENSWGKNLGDRKITSIVNLYSCYILAVHSRPAVFQGVNFLGNLPIISYSNISLILQPTQSLQLLLILKKSNISCMIEQ